MTPFGDGPTGARSGIPADCDTIRGMAYRFFDDYSDGGHPLVLDALIKANSGQQAGYGMDDFCRLASERIQQRFSVDADVHFVAGATQANVIGLSSMLRPHQGIMLPRRVTSMCTRQGRSKQPATKSSPFPPLRDA